MPDLKTLVWLRHDLRLADNPALAEARKRGLVVPVFIWTPGEEGDWPPGSASKWWLHQSLGSLDTSLREAGSRLVVRRGSALETLRRLATETGALAVHWNRRYEPLVVERDTRIKIALRQDGLTVESFNAALLHEPWTIQNQSGKPFQVFTPFWKNCLNQTEPSAPLPPLEHLPGPAAWPRSLALSELELEPKIDWARGFRSVWQPGEAGAARRLTQFLEEAVENYAEHRNQPDLAGTSRLSPHLHFGEISPRQVWHALVHLASKRGWPAAKWRGSQFMIELGWREFAHHLLFHFPHTTSEPLRAEFNRFPWRTEPAWLRAWQRGRTGFPIVDAGMRELWTTGWMHNRVRMIVASFLVKDLLISWQEGASWFWDTLLDADLANNTLGWQWTAGCGADAAPYFRVFNPVSQGRKFDPQGAYVRRWCPELAKLPPAWIHEPHRAPEDILRAAGVVLDRDYPQPIISHALAREVALDAFKRLQKTGPRAKDPPCSNSRGLPGSRGYRNRGQ
jgi:deoxyribodipyrimidine photo-lyase